MKGHLVIAGGNVKDDEIYEEFLKYASGGKIAIVPAASGDTAGTLIDFTEMFKRLGVDAHRIIGIKLDADKRSDDSWKRSGDSFTSFDFLNDVKGVWFTGGDQIKITRALIRNDGKDTRLLKKFREILDSGGVIGGSSAGAAIMSEIMIGGGTSYGAFNMPYFEDYIEYREKPYLEEEGILLITKGLGFFKSGIIDQHFDERCRLGRLVKAMLLKKINLGFGISENTALIYNGDTHDISAAGPGRITIVDISEAEEKKIGDLVKISKLKLKYIKNGENTSGFFYSDICFDTSLETMKVENLIAAVK